MHTITQSIILFITTCLSGLCILSNPQKSKRYSKILLTFGGSFLFCLTLLHVLPELYKNVQNYHYLLYFLLFGFFFQFFLDLLSHGIAHGHVDKTHTHRSSGHAFGLFIALFIHAVFDGLLVSGAGHGHDHGHSLLGGILLHKIPTTFSLIIILLAYHYKKRTIVLYLLLFALASPLGCILPYLMEGNNLFGQEALLACWALAVGNLLHIATTILAEANEDHRFSPSKIVAYLAGALLAIMADFC